MLTASEIQSMRDVAESALPSSAVITARTSVSDGGGGGSMAYTAAGTVPCRISPMNGNEQAIADRISSKADYIVTLPAETSVTTDSRLLIDGQTYGVEAVRDRGEWEITRRVEVERQS